MLTSFYSRVRVKGGGKSHIFFTIFSMRPPLVSTPYSDWCYVWGLWIKQQNPPHFYPFSVGGHFATCCRSVPSEANRSLMIIISILSVGEHLLTALLVMDCVFDLLRSTITAPKEWKKDFAKRLGRHNKSDLYLTRVAMRGVRACRREYRECARQEKLWNPTRTTSQDKWSNCVQSCESVSSVPKTEEDKYEAASGGVGKASVGIWIFFLLRHLFLLAQTDIFFLFCFVLYESIYSSTLPAWPAWKEVL